MAFPASPVDGQTYVNNNVTYVYSAGLGVWNVQGAVATASPVLSVAGRTGAVTLTAADVASGTWPGAMTAASTITVNGVLTAASSTASTGTTSGALVVTGGAGIGGAVYVGGAATVTGAATFNGGLTASALTTSGALTAASLSISGGINATAVGATTASTGAFTTLSASGTFTGAAANMSGAMTLSGNNGITFGPNSSWSAYLKVGGNGIDGTTAQVAATNGNLHLESLGASYPIYLNYYRSGGVNAYGFLNVTGGITATTTVVAYYSDERLKTKISKIDNALDKIDELAGFLYVENDLARSLGFNNTERQVALSAQAVKRVQPEAVSLAPFDRDKDGNSKSGENYLTVNYERLVPLLVEGIKELRQELNSIKLQLK